MSDCTIIVPTRDRPHLIRRAVDSALEQCDAKVSVLVVDDGSDAPVELPSHPRLRLARHPRPRGVAAARNLGTSLAATPFVGYLDDDDVLRPDHVAHGLATIAASTAPPPVASLSAIAVLNAAGGIDDVRVPPRLSPRGAHFSLEPNEPGRSHFSKQTLLVPREVVLGIGGFDERLRSRVVTELFWRLNPVCSIVGSGRITYELHAHAGARLSTDGSLRRRSFRQLSALHRELLRDHPRGHAQLLAQHARASWHQGHHTDAAMAALRWATATARRTLPRTPPTG